MIESRSQFFLGLEIFQTKVVQKIFKKIIEK
jgi:hypothetical protein